MKRYIDYDIPCFGTIHNVYYDVKVVECIWKCPVLKECVVKAMEKYGTER